jgi:hypothetical protein
MKKSIWKEMVFLVVAAGTIGSAAWAVNLVRDCEARRALNEEKIEMLSRMVAAEEYFKALRALEAGDTQAAKAYLSFRLADNRMKLEKMASEGTEAERAAKQALLAMSRDRTTRFARTAPPASVKSAILPTD